MDPCSGDPASLPLAPQQAPDTRPAGRRVLILANPHAGTRKSKRLVDELAAALVERRLEPTVCWERERLSDVAAAADPAEVRCVVAAGGDGTLLEVLNRAPGLPVSVLPLGNENLVGRYGGLPRSGRRLAAIIEAGRLRRVDLARANGRLFALMASAGFDAEVVHRVHARRQGHISKLSYAWPVVQALREYSFSPIDVEIEDTGERLQGALVFVFNLPRYGLNLPIPVGARPDDGLVDVYVFQKPGALALARYLTAVLLGQQKRLTDYRHCRARRVRLSAAGPIPVQLDGDPAHFLPVTIEVTPGAMTLVVPR